MCQKILPQFRAKIYSRLHTSKNLSQLTIKMLEIPIKSKVQYDKDAIFEDFLLSLIPSAL